MSGCAFRFTGRDGMSNRECDLPENHLIHVTEHPGGHAYVAPAPQPCPVSRRTNQCGACSRGDHADCSGWCFCPQGPCDRLAIAQPQPLPSPATPDAPVLTMPPGSIEIGSANVRLQQPTPPTQGAGDGPFHPAAIPSLDTLGRMLTNQAETIGQLRAENEQLRARLAAIDALVDYSADQLDDEETVCAKCGGLVSVDDGSEWENGDVCHLCAQGIVEGLRALTSPTGARAK